MQAAHTHLHTDSTTNEREIEHSKMNTKYHTKIDASDWVGRDVKLTGQQSVCRPASRPAKPMPMTPSGEHEMLSLIQHEFPYPTDLRRLRQRRIWQPACLYGRAGFSLGKCISMNHSCLAGQAAKCIAPNFLARPKIHVNFFKCFLPKFKWRWCQNIIFVRCIKECVWPYVQK